MSGRQIDRFFRANPDEAAGYLADGFWERRAIAVRYAPLEAIPALARDPDEVVRRAVATRLPPAELAPLARDPDREVRITVAQRLPEASLFPLAGDPDYMVRVIVARRLSHGKLPRLEKLFGLFARLDRPIDFEALDGQPVDLIFLLLAPESAGADHLKALARVARMLREPEITRRHSCE